MFERLSLFAAVVALAACGSSSSPASSPVAPTPPGPVAPAPPAGPSGPQTVTLTATGFSPQEVTVSIGARVTFVNGDRIGREISSGFDHNAPECPEIDVVGFLVPGQSRETFVFERTKTCRFHEHSNVGVAAFQGRVVVQ